MRSLKDNVHGVVDLTMVLMIGIAFTTLMVIGFIVWTLRGQLYPIAAITDTPVTWSATQNNTLWARLNSTQNVTNGFDNAVNLLIVAITIFILAIAISALLMLRGR